MNTTELLDVANDALSAEGVTPAGPQMPLSTVDLVTRWSVAVALEKATNHRAPDTTIDAATTLGDLLALYATPDDVAADAPAEGPLSADAIRQALGL
ncbi:hypothetical protein [Neoactinobaculum massilliense]|uniref:hypothetical protein n=1 Tax=Neoactinobaculum massilliense TaxID=2364794 RepID=UPI000F51F415|nr:hypothetical protein [Neoactinobaculum massilliense]